jgi:hypothetical protein
MPFFSMGLCFIKIAADSERIVINKNEPPQCSRDVNIYSLDHVDICTNAEQQALLIWLFLYINQTIDHVS